MPKCSLAEKCSFSAIPCVWIRIVGEPRGKFPVCPDDHGFLKLFLDFLRENNILPVPTPATVGGGLYCHAFYPDDAEKVLEWLNAQECPEVDFYDQKMFRP